MRFALHWQILIAMLLGATIGILLNRNLGNLRTVDAIELQGQSVQVRGLSSAVRLPAGRAWVDDTPDRILIRIEARDGGGTAARLVAVKGPVDEGPLPWPGEPFATPAEPTLQVTSVKELAEADPVAYTLFYRHGRSTARYVGDLAQQLGDLFLRMLKMVSIPLIITSLVTGVVGLGRADRLGKMFGRTLIYYMATSLIAIVVGLTAVNVIRPGIQSDAAVTAERQPVPEAGGGKSLGAVLFEQVENLIPPNPFHAATNGEFLSVIAFSIAFGVFTIVVGGPVAGRIGELADACFQVMMRMTMGIIQLAPLGVFFLMLAATSSQGLALFGFLGKYMLTVALALAVHALLVLPLIVRFVAGRSPGQYVRALSPALLTAFSSASSNGTLPLTMSCTELRAGVSNRVTSFVLPLGATVNMDGTALYEVVAVLFIAQYNGISLDLSQQIIVAFTALLASVGAAGIPHAGLVMMLIILQAVGLPAETQGLIIAVDRVLDMARTSVNVWSDACGCVVVERWSADKGLAG